MMKMMHWHSVIPFFLLSNLFKMIVVQKLIYNIVMIKYKTISSYPLCITPKSPAINLIKKYNNKKNIKDSIITKMFFFIRFNYPLYILLCIICL